MFLIFRPPHGTGLSRLIRQIEIGVSSYLATAARVVGDLAQRPGTASDAPPSAMELEYDFATEENVPGRQDGASGAEGGGTNEARRQDAAQTRSATCLTHACNVVRALDATAPHPLAASRDLDVPRATRHRRSPAVARTASRVCADRCVLRYLGGRSICPYLKKRKSGIRAAELKIVRQVEPCEHPIPLYVYIW